MYNTPTIINQWRVYCAGDAAGPEIEGGGRKTAAIGHQRLTDTICTVPSL